MHEGAKYNMSAMQCSIPLNEDDCLAITDEVLLAVSTESDILLCRHIHYSTVNCNTAHATFASLRTIYACTRRQFLVFLA